MSKLTEAIAFLAPLGSESDPLHGFFDPERRKAMRTLLDQVENDRSQIAQLNAKLAKARERLLKYEVPSTATSEYVDPVQPGQIIEYKPGIEPTNERLLRRAEESEEKLARIAEIIGTTDVPESTLLARRQLPLEVVLVDLFDAKLKAVAGILGED